MLDGALQFRSQELPTWRSRQKRKGKLSEFGIQLREKQKARRVYGILESQFRKIFDDSVKERGVTSEIFFRNLELRLDNVAFRMGFASSRNEARQIVRHNHIEVNGKRLNIPSARLKVGDIVTLSSKSQKNGRFTAAADLYAKRAVLPWIDVDHTKHTEK